MGNSYVVWDVEEEQDTGREIPAKGTPKLQWWEVARDAEHAAEMWAEQRWSDYDSPETMSCFVRSPDGTVTRWKVEAEPTVNFNASQEEVEAAKSGEGAEK